MDLVLFVTADGLPRPDTETPLVVAELEAMGIAARMVPWDAPLRWADAELVVVRSTWDYHRRLGDFLAWCDRVQSRTRLVNPAAVLHWNSHKSYLVDLAAAGVPTVPTRVVPQGTRVAPGDPLCEGSGAVVVKPAVSNGAVGALRGERDDPRLRRHLAELAGAGDVLVQPFVESVVDAGETSLVYLDGELSHAVCKRPAHGDYRVQTHLGATVGPHRVTAAELRVGERALATVADPCLYARVDLVATVAGPAVMELELIEPALFLGHDPDATRRLAAGVVRWLGGR